MGAYIHNQSVSHISALQFSSSMYNTVEHQQPITIYPDMPLERGDAPKIVQLLVVHAEISTEASTVEKARTDIADYLYQPFMVAAGVIYPRWAFDPPHDRTIYDYFIAKVCQIIADGAVPMSVVEPRATPRTALRLAAAVTMSNQPTSRDTSVFQARVEGVLMLLRQIYRPIERALLESCAHQRQVCFERGNPWPENVYAPVWDLLTKTYANASTAHIAQYFGGPDEETEQALRRWRSSQQRYSKS